MCPVWNVQLREDHFGKDFANYCMHCGRLAPHGIRIAGW